MRNHTPAGIGRAILLVGLAGLTTTACACGEKLVLVARGQSHASLGRVLDVGIRTEAHDGQAFTDGAAWHFGASLPPRQAKRSCGRAATSRHASSRGSLCNT